MMPGRRILVECYKAGGLALQRQAQVVQGAFPYSLEAWVGGEGSLDPQAELYRVGDGGYSETALVVGQGGLARQYQGPRVLGPILVLRADH